MSIRNEVRERQKTVIEMILAILLPPIGVFLREGLRLHFWINIILTVIGYIPGIIHAVLVIMSRRKHDLNY